MEAIMDHLVAARPVDRLVLLTHSQGSVIAYDYLRSAQQFGTKLENVGEIHLLTLGSPLSHLYAYYFKEYQMPSQELPHTLRSWSNFWRLDDPIGNRVDVAAVPWIDNCSLPPGGHMNYWGEEPVLHAMAELICASPPSEAAASRPQKELPARK
jgi:hypothetical protein